jgi:hypothetical protein
MNTSKTNRLVVVALVAFMALFAADARAQQVSCTSPAGKVTAVTNPAGHTISAKYQDELQPMQSLLKTRILATADGCLIAHLSGQVRITDNYVAFQVRVDGVPLEGQLLVPPYSRPIVFVALDSNADNQDEQYIDPTKVVSFNMFTRLQSGVHVVEVLGAAGSGIDTGNKPTVSRLVLTLEYP